ncbi:MAG: TlpA family protein disulfide reductase [Prosthecobacter sp.]|jgi:peroxiredoxin|uniref:TlpA family protein disulfide reductase n=1 Tax=Prosthecobacter sp. TaxID=1965333 RepID=UPI001A006602|nr:TlpA disulfide reductase family protein [Prosthecobacter sp.]MBE2286046.1 TlpA family protein disulfide reductase [Prosthecobacter sp.]
MTNPTPATNPRDGSPRAGLRLHSSFAIRHSSIFTTFVLLLSITLLPASELHWENGEWIGGHPMEITNDHVVWRSEIFTEPLKVSLSVLRRIRKLPEDRPTKETFSLRMADGSRLYGSIIAMDAKTVTVKAARFGTIKIERSAVASIKRLKGAGLLFAAPTSTSGWVEKDVKNNNKLWRVVGGAALKQFGWNRSVTLPLELPELVEMQFDLSATVRPEFKLTLKASATEQISIETWMDELVLNGRSFQALRTLKESDHRATLTLVWNRKTGLCAVYSADGKKLAEASERPPEAAKKEDTKAANDAKPAGGGLFGALLGVVQGAAQAQINALRVQAEARGQPQPETMSAGVTLLNKGPDLRLEGLRIREWSGVLPTDLTNSRPRVELSDGHHLKASVVSADAAGLTLRSKDNGSQTTLSWDKVLAIEMEPHSPFFGSLSPGTELWFADGEWISGLLLHLRNEVATMVTGWCKDPVSFKFGEARRFDLRENKPGPSSPPLNTLDVLTIGDSKKALHGTLDGDGQPQPSWRVVGGLHSARMINAGSFQITRAARPQADDTRAAALFYLSSGDTLPGTLRAIDSRQVDIDSSVSSVKHLPADKLQAIQFGGAPLNLDGFEDPGWQRIRGGASTVKRSGKAALELEPGGSWAHPSFMQVNEISFSLLSTGFNALRVRLFCEGVNPAAPSTNLLFGHMGSEVCFGLEASGDQMDRQFRVSSSGPANVRIVTGENDLEIFINNVSARRINLGAKPRGGGGIIIEPFSLWGNGERQVKIQEFSARIAPGRVAVPIVDTKSKEHALTVPRFRKEDPPRHALLAANGDLLRGVIEAATARHFAIRSGLETIQVPRDRVKAAVWLVQPADAVSAAFAAEQAVPPVITHWLLLNNGGRLGLKVDRFDQDAVVGKNELLGDCRVPLPQVHIIRTTTPPESAALAALRDWKLKYAPEPVLPESGGQSSPLLNQPAKTFKLPLLAGGELDLAQEKGKVLVLDFWATWCGPCIKSLPDMIDQMAGFDPQKVRFIGVNQGEAKEQVKTFLETRGWKFEVAFDANQRIGQSFGVEGIPHTVIIDEHGSVAYVKTGYEPDGAKKIAETVKKLLEK